MYGPPSSLQPDGSGRAAAQPPQQQHIHIHPNFPNQNLYINPAFLPPINPFIGTSSNFPPVQQQFPGNNFPFQPNPTNNFQIPRPGNRTSNDSYFSKVPQHQSDVQELLMKVDKAVARVRHDLVMSNKYVTAWDVSQAALLMVKAESWETLGFQMQQVPSLNRLLLTEGKINAFIHCFVAVRRITSLHDLEVAICESEGINRFEELELGPLIGNPLALHYFSVSSEVTEVYKIGSEEIISLLCEFMDTNKKKEVEVDSFLDFISGKHSTNGKEKLCLRIQNIGMFTSFIKRARHAEDTVLQNCLEKSKRKASQKSKKRPLFSAQKKQLDDNFNAISQRIKYFSSENTQYGGKHIHFVSCSSGDDVSEDTPDDTLDEMNSNINQLPFSNTKINHHNSCPYPSATEEKTRLGLKIEVACSPGAAVSGVTCNMDEQSKRKRKPDTISSNTSLRKPSKNQKKYLGYTPKALKDQCINDFSLPIESLKLFVTTWKEACRESNIEEVLERMLHCYNVRKKKKVKTLFTSFPFAGLLNASVTCIKSGVCDNMYDTFQDFSNQCTDEKTIKSASNYINIDVETVKNDVTISTQTDSMQRHGVTSEDILKKVAGYFEDDILKFTSPSWENNIFLLRKLCKCEQWLIDQYSIITFESLGYGEYFVFLDKYMHLLPALLQSCLRGDIPKRDSLEAHFLPLQFHELLLQALDKLWDTEADLQSISELLAMQFPLVCFKPVKSDAENITDILPEKRMTSNCLFFSSPLLRFGCTSYSVAQNEDKLSGINGLNVTLEPGEGKIGAVTTKDVVEVLLKAPMLTDLRLWSHWDRLFAPSLGSIVKWLLTDVNATELVCLVTNDAKLIRINHLATTDSLLEVFVRGSAFDTAVELLSLFALYGGERNVPLSLLKCHARQAFEVLVNNSLEMELHDTNSLMHGKLSSGQFLVGKSSTIYPCTELLDSRSVLNKGVSVISRFILDCLSYFPIEFCSFAADVLISGAQFFSKDIPSAILSQCKQLEQRLMLHEVGLSLGLMEWVEDYNSLRSSATSGVNSQLSFLGAVNSEFTVRSTVIDVSNKHPSSHEILVSSKVDHQDARSDMVVNDGHFDSDEVSFSLQNKLTSSLLIGNQVDSDPVAVIESIRQEEFGVGSSGSAMENKMLEKQHARLGRALQCLSQELYSQDSHFLLELVQNADDNIYPNNVEPTLTFILHEKTIIVLNNEQGFSEKDIRALCDVGNSTKKGQNAGYIGKKGIGFKSVFRVSDAPEIHSNGFHVKFDITEGQIGFVLPTIVPPHDIHSYSGLLSTNADRVDSNSWNTCIVLPFKSSISEGFGMNYIVSMFSNLHPSLLLFLHRIRCLKHRNILNDSLLIMRKKVVGNGIVEVSLGNDKMTWFVVSRKLQADVIRADVQTSEISIAFPIQETSGEGYIPILKQQPVFAFLPLRTYGLKFILHGDFVLPSSREEVDGNSPWNQWLLSEFPDLFISSERSFCDLPCHRTNPGKAITMYMSFIPLAGEVHGFFSSLPRMIISKLRSSNCLLLDSDEEEWVPPCKVLRNWSVQTRSLLPDSLINKHLGLGFLNKDVIISDSLARALGVEDYGPKILLNIISSLCCSTNDLELMGLSWLSSWINAVYEISSYPSIQTSYDFGTESEFIVRLQKIPFIPLVDGSYGSVSETAIWLTSDVVVHGFKEECILKSFSKLYDKLRTVSPRLLAEASSVQSSSSDSTVLDNVTRMLYKVGVQRLSAHEIVKMHILPAISDEKHSTGEEDLLIEYLSFAMFHLQSSCSTCIHERDGIMSELRERALVLTNFGYKRLNEVSLHFTQEYGNPVDLKKLIQGSDMKWHEIDTAYVNHPTTRSISGGEMMWRIFFQELGVTDFVQIIQVEKRISDMLLVDIKDIICGNDMIVMDAAAKNWESEELFCLLSWITKTNNLEKSKYLLNIIDGLWDDYFSDKINGYWTDSTGQTKTFKSSLISILQDVPWIASTDDKKLHSPKDLFYDCEAVNSVLGVNAPYIVPKVRNKRLLADIGVKSHVSLVDALSFLKRLAGTESPFKSSVSQMSNLYSLIWSAMPLSKNKIMEELLSGPFIFVPFTSFCSHDDILPGSLLSPQDVYWNDNIGSLEQMNSVHSECAIGTVGYPLRKMLYNIYPKLYDFFVVECGVNENPPLCSYLHILLQLSTVTLPHQAAKTVFKVFLWWSDALKSGSMSLEDVEYLKAALLKKENTILPTRQDRWVSLHASYGLVCWCNDDELGMEFKHLEGIDLLNFGELTDEEDLMNQEKIMTLNNKLGIPALSEMVTREAICYGPADCGFFFSLMNWILPFAQRYIFNVHPDRYFQLKQTDFEKIKHLKIVVVEELFYQNVIKRCKILSKKRYTCNCLLQDNIFYCSRVSYAHSIFMEFSRLLYCGTPDLQFANFLHMVTTMAESGATEEQIDFFILNSQKVQKIPVDEPCWFLHFDPPSSVEINLNMVENYSEHKLEQNSSVFKKKFVMNSNWPPVSWKTAPGFKAVNSIGFKRLDVENLQLTGMDGAEANQEKVVIDQCEIDQELRIQDNSLANISGTIILDPESSKSHSNPASNFATFGPNTNFDPMDFAAPNIMNFSQPNCGDKEQLSGQQEALNTGRQGELEAFKFLIQKYENLSVNWVNEANETGLPYDIVIGDEDSREYIEVKATKTARKNWFFITMKEWQFAMKKGTSFSIAHVTLFDNRAKITLYKNPARLCELGNIKLAIVVPK